MVVELTPRMPRARRRRDRSAAGEPHGRDEQHRQPEHNPDQVELLIGSRAPPPVIVVRLELHHQANLPFIIALAILPLRRVCRAACAPLGSSWRNKAAFAAALDKELRLRDLLIRVT
jgi:hypothetical protein